jgi:hypothetical protein
LLRGISKNYLVLRKTNEKGQARQIEKAVKKIRHQDKPFL